MSPQVPRDATVRLDALTEHRPVGLMTAGAFLLAGLVIAVLGKASHTSRSADAGQHERVRGDLPPSRGTT